MTLGSRGLTGSALGVALLATVLAIGHGHRSEAAFPGLNGRIAFESNRDGDFEIYTMDSSGGDVRRLTNSPGFDERPAYSPDGELIAFWSPRSGSNDIWVMNADGSNQRRLTTHPGDDTRLAFSPDGQTIAFTSTRGGDQEIWTIDVDGSDPVQLTNAAATSANPDYSPDGTKIAFASNRDGPATNFEIYSMNADGSNQVRLTNDAAEDSLPSWSPDGAKIVFNSKRSDPDADIWAMDADGTDQAQLTTDPAEDAGPVFSPDGTKILFHTSREGPGRELYLMDPSGANQVPLTATAEPIFNIHADWQSLDPPAPPPPPPPPSEPPADPVPDTAAPILTLAGDKKQPVGRTVEVTASCNETCSLAATGTLSVRTPDRERARTLFELTPAAGTGVEPAQTATLALGLKRKLRRAALAALGDGGRAKVKIIVTATDPAGNSASAKRGAKLLVPPD